MKESHDLKAVDSSASAFEAYEQGRYKEALPLLTSAADRGDVAALLAVGWINETGASGAQDLEFAKVCYRRAAELGSLDALYRLGRILKESDDAKAALSVFEQGAEQQHLPCISALGHLMLNVSKSTQETEIGMKYLNDAASRGHFYARGKLVVLEMEKEDSIFQLLRLLKQLFIIRIERFVERRTNRYSEKLL